MSEVIREIFTDQIDDPIAPMRSELDRTALFELSDNIKQNGLINPITVRPVGARYEVVAGHRRLSACKIAGIIKISCVVRDLSDKEVFAVKAAENLERADVDPVDEANFIAEFLAQPDVTTDDVVRLLRRSKVWVQTRMEVGKMPDYMKGYLKIGGLKLGAALALYQIDNDAMRQAWVEMAVRDGISVGQAEMWLENYKRDRLPGGLPPTDYEPGVSEPIKFECAVDGKKYDARLFKVISVYEGNLPVLQAVLSELRKPPVSAETP